MGITKALKVRVDNLIDLVDQVSMVLVVHFKIPDRHLLLREIQHRQEAARCNTRGIGEASRGDRRAECGLATSNSKATAAYRSQVDDPQPGQDQRVGLGVCDDANRIDVESMGRCR